MTQEDADKIFQGGLGGQLLSFFSTSDDMLWVRYEEAVTHTQAMRNAVGDNEYVDTSIIEWFESDGIRQE